MFSSFAKSSSLSQVWVCALLLPGIIIFLERQNLTLKLYAIQYNLEFLSPVSYTNLTLTTKLEV